MKITLLVGIIILFAISGCNPFYVIQAGITQSEILLNRRDIDRVIEDPSTSPETIKKLELVQSVREYSKEIALKPEGSFTSYSALDRDTLAWIVLAARPDAFELHTWWFPIVGRVPYKGYFSPESAQCEANRLKAKGYETLVRGTQAFSTLGWFNDPVMTPMLKNSNPELAETVLHEILHTTLWVPNYVAFNESAANFVGHRAAVSYYQSELKKCSVEQPLCDEQNKKYLDYAEKSLGNALAISSTLEQLIPELDQLYKSSQSKEEKMIARETIFQKHMGQLRTRIPELKILKSAHNAEIMQLQLYYTKLSLFQQMWDNCRGEWPAFITMLKTIADAVEEQDKEPFSLLSQQCATLDLNR